MVTAQIGSVPAAQVPAAPSGHGSGKAEFDGALRAAMADAAPPAASKDKSQPAAAHGQGPWLGVAASPQDVRVAQAVGTTAAAQGLPGALLHVSPPLPGALAARGHEAAELGPTARSAAIAQQGAVLPGNAAVQGHRAVDVEAAAQGMALGQGKVAVQNSQSVDFAAASAVERAAVGGVAASRLAEGRVAGAVERAAASATAAVAAEHPSSTLAPETVLPAGLAAVFGSQAPPAVAAAPARGLGWTAAASRTGQRAGAPAQAMPAGPVAPATSGSGTMLVPSAVAGPPDHLAAAAHGRPQAQVGGGQSLRSSQHAAAGVATGHGESGRTLVTADPLAAGMPGSAPAPQGAAAAPVQSGYVAEQVAAAVARAAAAQDAPASVRLQLDPPQLGHVQVTLRAGQEGIVAVLRADNPATVALLQDGQEDLRQRLGALGFRASAVEVTTAEQPRIVTASGRSSAGRRSG